MMPNSFVLAGTNSGCGKTTISIGIMAALKKRGLIIQPFKIGPDYIDPLFHSFVTGRKGRNLDSWLLETNILRYLFLKNSQGADISIVEGVMGLYDGFGTTWEGSTAHTAQILNLPVVLVLNASGMSLSAAALIEGFCHFQGYQNVKGVILNCVKTQSQYKFLKNIIEQKTGIKVYGFLKKEQEFSLESRHLGLSGGEQAEKYQSKIELLANSVTETIDLEGLLQLSKTVERFESPCIPFLSELKNKYAGLRIGVALDSAFHFYYADNIELLEYMGAKLVYFSPLKHKCLPEKLDGIYIGGGYPELHLEELSQNISFRQELKESIQKGMPVYGECGGLMYLCEAIRDIEQNSFAALGAFKGSCEMGKSLRHFGYVEVEIISDCLLGKKGTKVRAHEFHYSHEEILEKSCFESIKKRDGNENKWFSGYCKKNVTGGYPHIHFYSKIEIAEAFLKNCQGGKHA